jgi:hypothetical protein
MEVSGRLHAPAALPPRKETLVPNGYEAGVGPRAGLDVLVKKKFSSPTGIRTPYHPARKNEKHFNRCKRYYSIKGR